MKNRLHLCVETDCVLFCDRTSQRRYDRNRLLAMAHEWRRWYETLMRHGISYADAETVRSYILGLLRAATKET